MCKSIPHEIAKNFNDQSLKNENWISFSPKIAPIGEVEANIISKPYFLMLLMPMLLRKNISTAAIGNLWMRIILCHI